MQSSYPLFFPHYPPPPTRELIINEGLKVFEQSNNDERWIQNWIERKQVSKQISLSDYRQKLIAHAQLLQQYENALQQSKHEVLMELKKKIEQANAFLYDGNTIQHIQQQIRRRKSKRARLRRQKQTKLIDTHQDLIEPSVTTHEKSVDKRIADIQSILRTIEQLQTIRQQRQKDNIDSSSSNDQLIEIQNICTAKLLEYQMKSHPSSSDVELCNYLFNNQNQSFYQSTNSDGQYLLRAHQNKTNLVQIRQEWDRYSSTNRSSFDNILPVKWHEPPLTSNWIGYIS